MDVSNTSLKDLNTETRVLRFMGDSNLQIIHDNVGLTLGTLAGLDAITAANSKIASSNQNGFRLMRSEVYLNETGFTDGEGPILIGMAASLTAAEIEEALEASPTGRLDDVLNTMANRPIWPLAVQQSSVTSTTDRRVIVVQPRWSLPEDGGLVYFAYNLSSSPLTTGTILSFAAKHFGVWLND